MNSHIKRDKSDINFIINDYNMLSIRVHQKFTLDPTKAANVDFDRRGSAYHGVCKLDVSEVPRRRPIGWKVTNANKNGWRYWQIICAPSEVIFPTREGERISKSVLFPENSGGEPFSDLYSLSYPGTASTKNVVVFVNEVDGFVVGSEPSLKWAEISLKPFSRKEDIEQKVIISFFQRENELYIIPFQKEDRNKTAKPDVKSKDELVKNIIVPKNWQTAVRNIPFIARKLNPELPRFMLQLGIRTPNREVGINHFLDQRLLAVIRKFRDELGPGNIIHLFGTNNAGFDNGFPDFSIDRTLGGVDSRKGVGLKKLVAKIHAMGLMASHHFNPRIASVDWLSRRENSVYRKAVLLDPNGDPWVEQYKNKAYNVMNPSDQDWQNYCIKWVRYFESIGFDYIELDQISYQRNIANPEDDVGTGFQDLINRADKGPGNVWTEGVSDIYQLPPGAWFQMLPRTRHEKWLNRNENRRGYAGVPYPQFYRNLRPRSPISYQVVMDSPIIDEKIGKIPERLIEARKLGAVVLDLELGFFNEDYEASLLPRTLEKIKEFAKNEKLNKTASYSNSIAWLNSWFVKH